MLTVMISALLIQAAPVKDYWEPYLGKPGGCSPDYWSETLGPVPGCERSQLGAHVLADLYAPARPEERPGGSLTPPQWVPRDRHVTVSDRLAWRGDAVRAFNAGNAAASKYEYADAAEAYGRSLARLDDGEVRMALGLSLLAVGNLDEAAVHLAKSLELRPGNPYASAGLTRTRHLLALRAVPPALR